MLVVVLVVTAGLVVVVVVTEANGAAAGAFVSCANHCRDSLNVSIVAGAVRESAWEFSAERKKRQIKTKPNIKTFFDRCSHEFFFVVFIHPSRVLK
jgi:MFS superfamily sulfate permease-like transporter